MTKNLAEKIVMKLSDIAQFWQKHNDVGLLNWLGEQLQRSLTCVGTTKKNKREIPNELQPRPVLSSQFCFSHNTTLVSFLPKVNTAVLHLMQYYA